MINIRTLFSKHKRIAIITAIAIVVALASGGYFIANSGPSKNVSGSLSTAKVIPFQQGAPSAATPVGQIPAGFKDGDGTLVTGASADKAKAAALAAFPGVNVNRVSVLDDGEYNVHIIGVNWPHHVFVDQDFKVVGAL